MSRYAGKAAAAAAPFILVAGTFAGAAAAASTTGPACWAESIELIDNVANPAEGGDQAFFTRVGGGPPSALMIFANTPSMFELPGFNPVQVPSAERGCARSTYLNSRIWRARQPLYAYSSLTSSATNCTSTIATPAQDGQGYDPLFTYPRIDDGCYLDRSYKTLDDFNPNLFYLHRQWSDSGAGTGRTAFEACFQVLNASEKSACQTCLDVGSPYYIPPSEPQKTIYRGNFLHFFGPTHLSALAAWKTAISSSARIRWGHGYYDNNLPGIAKGRDPNPECNKFDTDFNPANRRSYVNAFSNTPPPFGTISKFPLAQALFSLGYFLTDVNRFSSASTYVRTGVWTANEGKNQDTICSPCQYSATIVITDGTVSDDTVLPPEVKTVGVDTPGDKTMLGQPCSSPRHCGTSLQCVSGTCQDEWWADSVAHYFANYDVRHGQCGISSTNPVPDRSCDPEVQTMTTYVINVGPENPALRNIAKEGKGLYLRAASASDLREAMQNIINDIIRRATSFSVASVTSVQTRTTTAVFVPRFKPSVLTLWDGHLYRFKLFSEHAAGCIEGVDTVEPFNADKLSRNPNADGTCGDVYMMDGEDDHIGENDEGDFVKLNTSGSYPWPPTNIPAVPLWDGAEQVKKTGPSGRTIFTAMDLDNNGVIDPGEHVAFTTANAELLAPALGIRAANNDFCTAMAERTGLTFSTPAECATLLIRFIRGEDVFDEDADGGGAEAREHILGDIFHSSPALVVPPLNPFLCQLGANVQQCLESLARTPTPDGDLAYAAYHQLKGERDQFVLVGSNHGMLHAFHAGQLRTGNDPDTPVVEPSDHRYFDAGTGDELWAFIPPEMLPKLRRMLMQGGHREYVDGSPMVRDVWVDLNRDGRKSADEFRTMAVIGMRRGGRTHVALDVTDPYNPVFRWSNPPPGSDDYLFAGESWAEFAPRPPPIVPVVARAKSPYTGSFTLNGVSAREQWVVFLGGGYDPAGIRGRSIHAYDVWTGEQVYRFAFRENTGSTDPRRGLGPVAAAVATADWGDEVTNAFGPDYFFDTATVGDLFGNFWTVRFSQPGDDEDGDGLYDNWHTGRALETGKGGRLAEKLPFFEMASHSVLLDTKSLRAYVGTGDRARIRDDKGGLCDLGNVHACVRKGCSIDVSMSRQDIGSADSSGRWAASGTSTGPSTNSASGSSGTVGCGLRARVDYTTSLNCGSAGSGTYSYGLDCADGGQPCTTMSPRPLGINFPFDATTTRNRFFSFRLFDGTRVPFTTAAQALDYDGRRLSESDLADPDKGVFATSDSNGFLVEYAHQDERTSGAAFVPGGNALYWQTLTPLTNASICTREGTDTASIYRAHAVTGGTSFETGTNQGYDGVTVPRRTTSQVLTPPKTFITQKVITPGGEVVTVALSIEPGQEPLAVEAGRADLYAPIRVLEVDRPTHECRHTETPNCR